MDESDDLTVALTPLIDLLDRLEVTWYVGGSVASTVHGRFRATNDVDVIADLHEDHWNPCSAGRRGPSRGADPLVAQAFAARGAAGGPPPGAAAPGDSPLSRSRSCCWDETAGSSPCPVRW